MERGQYVLRLNGRDWACYQEVRYLESAVARIGGPKEGVELLKGESKLGLTRDKWGDWKVIEGDQQ